MQVPPEQGATPTTKPLLGETNVTDAGWNPLGTNAEGAGAADVAAGTDGDGSADDAGLLGCGADDTGAGEDGGGVPWTPTCRPLEQALASNATETADAATDADLIRGVTTTSMDAAEGTAPPWTRSWARRVHAHDGASSGDPS